MQMSCKFKANRAHYATVNKKSQSPKETRASHPPMIGGWLHKMNEEFIHEHIHSLPYLSRKLWCPF